MEPQPTQDLTQEAWDSNLLIGPTATGLKDMSMKLHSSFNADCGHFCSIPAFSPFLAPENQGGQSNASLVESPSLCSINLSNMTSPRSQNSPSSAQDSPSFVQHQCFLHNVHPIVSLNHESALPPGQVNKWSAAQFNPRCRSPAEYSDVSFVTHLPNVNMNDHTTNGRFRPCVKNSQDMPQISPVVDFTPTKNAKLGGFDATETPLDNDALLPPERDSPKSRLRSLTGLFKSEAAVKPIPSTIGSNLAHSQEASRSLNPANRHFSAAGRRQSISTVSKKTIALRLVNSKNEEGSQSGGRKRVQKHLATFQCPLCPKRFTRTYNLRSHLRTHTNDRPFVCTICGKAFTRQHDRRRHESLHSGEKKFICKGELKAGGQWGCERWFARADALRRHFQTEAGRICIQPLLKSGVAATPTLRDWVCDSGSDVCAGIIL